MDVIVPEKRTGELVHVEADPYRAALATWLQGKPDNTRRGYAGALRDFMAFTAGRDPEGNPKHPRDVEAEDVAGWKEHLKARGCADSTVAQRLSALSSYYAHLQRPQPDGPPLHTYNPVGGVDRDDLEVSPYENARKLSAGDFQRILAAIPTDTEAGARDRALFLFYVLCARRRREVLNLRGADLRADATGGKVVYRVRLKGGHVKWKELPPPVWEAIKRYLDLAGRTLTDDAPVFVASVESGRYLRAYYQGEATAEPEGERPITGQAVAQALKRYAARAGLDPDRVCLHSLRHLGAELYQEASGDLRQLQLFLDHAHLNTTQIYLAQLTGEDHHHWQAMANRLGVS